ncbi:hypothetical protein ABBQ38_011906 [Trebouxia sp. C0009 RCD-2024]
MAEDLFQRVRGPADLFHDRVTGERHDTTASPVDSGSDVRATSTPDYPQVISDMELAALRPELKRLERLERGLNGDCGDLSETVRKWLQAHGLPFSSASSGVWTAEWRLYVKTAAQAWMDDDGYIQDLTVASDRLLAEQGCLLPQDLLAKTSLGSLLGTSLMPALIRAMQEDMKPEMDFLISLAVSKLYTGHNDSYHNSYDVERRSLNDEMRVCAVTHIANTFQLTPFELPGSMQQQLRSELKEAHQEELRDVQSKMAYLRGVMKQVARRSQSSEAAEESGDSGSMSSWEDYI